MDINLSQLNFLLQFEFLPVVSLQFLSPRGPVLRVFYIFELIFSDLNLNF
jgi:hypothetical protein